MFFFNFITVQHAVGNLELKKTRIGKPYQALTSATKCLGDFFFITLYDVISKLCFKNICPPKIHFSEEMENKSQKKHVNEYRKTEPLIITKLKNIKVIQACGLRLFKTSGSIFPLMLTVVMSGFVLERLRVYFFFQNEISLWVEQS